MLFGRRGAYRRWPMLSSPCRSVLQRSTFVACQRLSRTACMRQFAKPAVDVEGLEWPRCEARRHDGAEVLHFISRRSALTHAQRFDFDHLLVNEALCPVSCRPALTRPCMVMLQSATVRPPESNSNILLRAHHSRWPRRVREGYGGQTTAPERSPCTFRLRETICSGVEHCRITTQPDVGAVNLDVF